MLIHWDALRVVEAPRSAASIARRIVVRVAFAGMFGRLATSYDRFEGESRHANGNGGYDDRDPLNFKEVGRKRFHRRASSRVSAQSSFSRTQVCSSTAPTKGEVECWSRNCVPCA